MPTSCCTCQLMETAQSLGDDTHAVANCLNLVVRARTAQRCGSVCRRAESVVPPISDLNPCDKQQLREKSEKHTTHNKTTRYNAIPQDTTQDNATQRHYETKRWRALKRIHKTRPTRNTTMPRMTRHNRDANHCAIGAHAVRAHLDLRVSVSRVRTVSTKGA